jgi:hypothetical protein
MPIDRPIMRPWWGAVEGTCRQANCEGIQCAFTGKPWLSFSVAVDMEASEEATTCVRLAMFGQLATRGNPRGFLSHPVNTPAVASSYTQAVRE